MKKIFAKVKCRVMSRFFYFQKKIAFGNKKATPHFAFA
jgi:hypothetical protein